MKTTALLCAAAFAWMVGAANAQETFPTQPITIVVPFAAGGPTDTVTRLIAEPMSRELGQQVVVSNVAGAGGTLASSQVAKAKPDGYTILMHHIGMSTAPTLYRNLDFNAETDFATLGLVTNVPMTLIARKDFEPTTLQDLVTYVKANKDEVVLANAGIGAASHLCGMLFMNAIDTAMTTVPYKGTGPAMTDILAGEVDIMCDQSTNTTGQIKGGEVKVYAVTTPERLGNLPDVPTTAEAGLPGFQVGVWHGLYAPKGTDPAIVDKISKALQKSLTDPKVIERFAELGTTPVAQDQATPDAHKAYLAAQIALWKPIIEKAGVFAD